MKINEKRRSEVRMKVSGNDLFVTAMKKEGVDTIFAYPGGMVVNLLDALHDCHSIDLVLPRHEQGLIHAADGYARATGKVGVCLVTSGPGATNLVTGIATANYDSIPLVCFTGQVPEHLIGNDAFQEVDIIGVKEISRSLLLWFVTERCWHSALKKLFTLQDPESRDRFSWICQRMLWQSLVRHLIRPK